ncbi:putative Ntn-hydrolase superfamily protein [Arthrobacter pigmenti]|uniref:Putative Ntn-hydrolase superfamily protein n=1 Tax=Arthrobacter pigmenti TaxID=271432 RepID=A0A846RK16_9MICC|nr:putative Ntn-hydrolase superfamily protein [Arthrobacter pigmenti]
MTFSIAATDGEGRFGLAVSSSSPAVAARCAHLRDGVGVVSSQNITDPRLGGAILDRMQAGASAQEALDAVVRDAPAVDFRQLVVLDASGGSAVFSGAHTLGTYGEGRGPNCVAAGNMLASADVAQALCDGFEAATGELEERLLAAMRAAEVAGGEAGPVMSAGLSVVSGHGWRDTDLRVDWHEDPIAELERLLEVWLPQREDYVIRGLDPAASVGYGVPGDDR